MPFFAFSNKEGNDLVKIFVSPSDFVLGSDVLKTGKDFLVKFGNKPFLLGDPFIMENVGKDFAEYLTDEGMKVTSVSFTGEATMAAIDSVGNQAKDADCDFLIGLGGGKTIDTAKSAASNLGIPLVIIPTLASTDAPTSRLAVIYKEDGSLENYLGFNANPNLVLVDSKVIAGAPTRFLAAGFGDALSTWIEARAIKRAFGKTILSGHQTLTALAIAEKCEEVIFEYAFEALEANAANVVTPALEYAIEANILMSGLGFESGGTCAVHPIQNAFLVLGRGKNLMHGERVAFGILCQLMMEGAPKAEFDRYLDFLIRLGLPTTLEDQGLADITAEELKMVGETANAPWESIHQLPAEVTPESVVNAIVAVDKYATTYKKEHGFLN
ncbi:hypothetical protein RU97_GL002228 [Enterococcus canis]|uniref:Glycerol dehydrogenase n=1 Tax=Enterococcus canis TaxID=214095 RepID=A0A1L8REP3_9ENTE|nr:hypothetical protein RU97_GL002228 [Enterococcus canis]